MRDMLGFGLLFVGVASVVLGIGAVARDMPLGWVAILAGAAANYSSHRVFEKRKKAESV